jgi:hypothetical protein
MALRRPLTRWAASALAHGLPSSIRFPELDFTGRREFAWLGRFS